MILKCRTLCLWWVLAAICSGLGGCTGCPYSEEPNMLIPQEVMDYFGFAKEGSWWAYQNQATGEVDTLFVTDYDLHTSSVEPDPYDDDCTYPQRLFVYLDPSRIEIIQNNELYLDIFVYPHNNNYTYRVDGFFFRTIILDNTFKNENQDFLNEDAVYFDSLSIGNYSGT